MQLRLFVYISTDFMTRCLLTNYTICFYCVGGFVFWGNYVGDGVGFGCGRDHVYQMLNEFLGVPFDT